MTRLWIICISLAAYSAAQQAPPQTAKAPADQKPIHVEGRVMGGNGEAVRRATVHLQSAGAVANGQTAQGLSQTSDDAGKFEFDNVAPGRYTLMAEKTGYLPARYGARSVDGPAALLTLAAGDQKKALDLRMIPQGVIVGRVTDQDGDPVANVPVTVGRYEYTNGRKTLTPVTPGISAAGGAATAAQTTAAIQAMLGGGGQRTDDQGNYRINNLPPGRYYVSVDPRASRGMAGIAAAAAQLSVAPQAAPEASNIVTYYPNAADVGTAAAVDVAAGSEVRGIDIRLRKEQVFSIRGKIVDPAGEPVGNASVMLLQPDGAGPNLAGILSNMFQSRADGSFEIRDLLPGTYTIQGMSIPGLAALTATMAGGRGGAAPAAPVSMIPRVTNRLEVGIRRANVSDAVLQITDGGEIAGVIKLENGNLKDVLAPATPQPQAMLALPPANRAIALGNADGATLSTARGQFAEDGTFKISGVIPGKYFVVVMLGAMPQGSYIKSMRFAGRDLPAAPLDVRAGAVGPLEIVISLKAADITGLVRGENGDPLQGIPVTLWPKVLDKSRQDSGIRTANTNQTGTFKITGLAPGDYYVAAWDDIPTAGLNENPDFLARFQSDDTSVSLAESAHFNMDAKLISHERMLVEAAKIQ